MNSVEDSQRSHPLSKAARRYLQLATVLSFSAVSYAVSYVIRFLISNPETNRIPIAVTGFVAGALAGGAVWVFGKFLNHILRERETS